MDISNKELKDIFAFNLNHRIRLKDLTHKDFAELAGVSSVCLSNYMTGKSLPSYESLLIFSEILECTPNDLMSNNKIVRDKAAEWKELRYKYKN